MSNKYSKSKGGYLTALMLLILLFLVIVIGYFAAVHSWNKNYNINNEKEDERFIVLESLSKKSLGLSWNDVAKVCIVVDRETDVEYLIVDDNSQIIIQPLYNPDGSLRTRE